MCLDERLFEGKMIKEFGEYEQWKKQYILSEFPLDVSIYNEIKFK